MAKATNNSDGKKSHIPPAPKERWPADFKAAGIRTPANPRAGCNIENIGRGRSSATKDTQKK